MAFQARGRSQSILVMLDLLNEIRVTGKISRAADRAGLSYRHAWNLIEKWSAFFEAPLVERKQGSGTSLTPFGDKLVWAGQRLQARLGPQLQNLSQELETEINQLLPRGPSIIRVHASHGFAVSKLRELLSREENLGVDLRYVSNQNSLVSLAHDGCDLAGMHLPQGELRKRSIAAMQGLADPQRSSRDRPGDSRDGPDGQAWKSARHRFTGAVARSGGSVRESRSGLRDSAAVRSASGAAQARRFQPSTATSMSNSRTRRWRAYVASGMADVSFGVEAAARQFDLDFVRLVTEDYFFVCRKQLLELEAMKRVLAIMRGEEFQAAISQLPGYRLKDAGSVKTLKEAF